MFLPDRCDFLDHAGGEPSFERIGQGGGEGVRHLQVVMRRIGRIGCVHANDQHRPGLVGLVGGAAMDGQRRPCRNGAALRHFLHRQGFVTRPALFGREHALRTFVDPVPLRARRNFERPHVGCGIDRREVEGERVDPATGQRCLRRCEVAVPRLDRRAREGNVKSDLHDLPFRSQYGFAYGDEPRVRRDLGKAIDAFRRDFDVPPLRTARQRSAVDRTRCVIKPVDARMHPVNKRNIIGVFQGDYAIAINPCHDPGDIIFGSAHGHPL